MEMEAKAALLAKPGRETEPQEPEEDFSDDDTLHEVPQPVDVLKTKIEAGPAEEELELV
jgi:hypothetical protein